MTTYAHFAEKMSAFFKKLAANQDRDWFLAHKARYETEVRDPLRDLLADLNEELAKRGVPLACDPVKAIFRINRDFRFSKDKSPYKNNIAACLYHDGVKDSDGLLYLHFSPEEMLVAAGFYGMEPAALTKLRQRIASKQTDWLEVEQALSKAGFELSDEQILKRLPKGFDAEKVEPVERALRLKSHTIRQPLTAKEIGKRNLVSRLGDFAETALPLLEFGWKAG
jgi:uncharacterized protein (TIGR02453 family)